MLTLDILLLLSFDSNSAGSQAKALQAKLPHLLASMGKKKTKNKPHSNSLMYDQYPQI